MITAQLRQDGISLDEKVPTKLFHPGLTQTVSVCLCAIYEKKRDPCHSKSQPRVCSDCRGSAAAKPATNPAPTTPRAFGAVLAQATTTGKEAAGPGPGSHLQLASENDRARDLAQRHRCSPQPSSLPRAGIPLDTNTRTHAHPRRPLCTPGLTPFSSPHTFFLTTPGRLEPHAPAQRRTRRPPDRRQTATTREHTLGTASYPDTTRPEASSTAPTCLSRRSPHLRPRPRGMLDTESLSAATRQR